MYKNHINEPIGEAIHQTEIDKSTKTDNKNIICGDIDDLIFADELWFPSNR